MSHPVSNSAVSQPAEAAPAQSSQAPASCGKFAVLAVLELAYRDRAGRPLHLPDQDLETEALRHHLQAERCPVCRRWYRNAVRAYDADADAARDPGEVETVID
jgi:hypothetical protein